VEHGRAVGWRRRPRLRGHRIGRGNNPNSHGNKPSKEAAEEKLQMVPLPTDREEIRDPTVRMSMESPRRPAPDAQEPP
jgi:hypothetical protein